ncbi:MAG: MerR family transcriptional regulator, heat shock protein HspR [Frankiaceae bacterium]|jgi:MerR family transcriptional regulator/heat shock protein HspR|nr:MerR family transcriptional regulator, heat shock protein HspR [Frankiaceae bacterium]
MADSPQPPTDQRPVYVISVAAELAGMHPQTLRAYDRQGLVTPGRATGRGRRYSERDVALLREVQRLSQDEGVNLAGVKRILELEAHVTALRARLAELQADLAAAEAEAARREADVHKSYRRELVPLNRSLVIWKPERRDRRGR